MKRDAADFVLLAGALLAALSGCQSRQHGALQVQRDSWSFRSIPGTTLTTPHYRIHTTCNDAALLGAIPRVMEGSLRAYRDAVPADNLPVGPMRAYLFASRPQWEWFTREFAGPRAATYLMIRSGGYEENGTIVAHYALRGVALSVLAHEGLHQYLSVTQRRGVPAWINEGLACQFESFELGDDGWPTFTPHRNSLRMPHLREAIKRGTLHPLPKLLVMDAGHAVHAGDQATRIFYAQVWSMVLFLREPGNPDGVGFRRLLAELGTEQMRLAGQGLQASAGMASGEPPGPEEAVFRFYVTQDLDGFWRRYEAFIRKLTELAT